MIKSQHKITVGDFATMEETGNISQFKKWYNPFPAILFAKRIKRTIEPLALMLSESTLDDLELELLEHKARTFIEVNQLRSLEVIIANHLGNRSHLLRLKNMIRSRKLRKINEKSDILRFAINRVKELTGIKIETVDEFEKFQKYLVNRFDRLEDLFAKDRQEPKSDKKVRLMKVVYSILIYLGIGTYGCEKMTIINFVELKNIAVEKMEAEKQLMNKTEKQ
jgi:hypothetical protein